MVFDPSQAMNLPQQETVGSMMEKYLRMRAANQQFQAGQMELEQARQRMAEQQATQEALAGAWQPAQEAVAPFQGSPALTVPQDNAYLRSPMQTPMQAPLEYPTGRAEVPQEVVRPAIAPTPGQAATPARLDYNKAAETLAKQGFGREAERIRSEGLRGELGEITTLAAINPELGVKRWNESNLGKQYGELNHIGGNAEYQYFHSPKTGGLTAVNKKQPLKPDGTPNIIELVKGKMPVEKETGAVADRRYENIQTKINLGEKVSVEDKAWMKSYEKRKNLGTAMKQEEVSGQASEIADAIIRGEQPPDLSGFGMAKVAPEVRRILSKKGYDMTKAQLDWKAMQKHITTLNSTQQVRLRQAVDFTYHSLDVVEDLAKQWQGSNFPLLNKANLLAAKQGAYGAEAAKVATQMESQINDLVSELGTVYKGGNASTDESLKLAASNLKAEWSLPVLLSNINLVRKNLAIRKNSLEQTGAAGLSKGSQFEKSSGSSEKAFNIGAYNVTVE